MRAPLTNEPAPTSEELADDIARRPGKLRKKHVQSAGREKVAEAEGSSVGLNRPGATGRVTSRVRSLV